VGTPVVTAGSTTSVDPGIKRPYTDEYTLGIDRDLGQALKLSAVYSYRRDRFQLGTLNTSGGFATTLTTRADAGPDGIAGTADDSTYQFYDRTSAANQVLVTNDPTGVQTYKGIELTVNKRFSNRWQALAGYTYAHTSWVDFSVPNQTTPNPNFALNMNGPFAENAYQLNGQIGDRPQQFKLTGEYVLPFYDIELAANFRSQSGSVITRNIATRPTVGGTFNVNVPNAASDRLDPVTTLDLRLGKNLRLGSRSIDAAVDFYNVLNANTVWDVRTLSGTLGFRQSGDPNGALNTLPQYLSPAQVLAPRIIRFSVAFRF
jgi:hypothetical protein